MKGVVIEGIRCCGKSELITSLKASLKSAGGFDVKELTHIDCNDQYARYLKEYATQDRVILHRSHVSEHVLGKILRSTSPFAQAELDNLNAILVSRFVCVLTEAPSFEEFVVRTAHRRVKEDFSRERYAEILSAFHDSFDHIPHIRYTSSSFSELEATRDAIIAELV
jgi:hypothetical protein